MTALILVVFVLVTLYVLVELSLQKNLHFTFGVEASSCSLFLLPSLALFKEGAWSMCTRHELGFKTRIGLSTHIG